MLVESEIKFGDVLELQNVDCRAKQHCLHQQPQREDQKERPEEVTLCYLFPIWPNTRHCCSKDFENARPSLRDIQGNIFCN